MNQDLEYELKRALRRKEPSRDLMPQARAFPWRLVLAAGLAISIAGPVGLFGIVQQRKAKDQLVFAFHLAAGKLEMTKRKLGTVK